MLGCYVVIEPKNILICYEKGIAREFFKQNEERQKMRLSRNKLKRKDENNEKEAVPKWPIEKIGLKITIDFQFVCL